MDAQLGDRDRLPPRCLQHRADVVEPARRAASGAGQPLQGGLPNYRCATEAPQSAADSTGQSRQSASRHAN
jgi:hypothetical protein